jgi:hypothetical protein
VEEELDGEEVSESRSKSGTRGPKRDEDVCRTTDSGSEIGEGDLDSGAGIEAGETKDIE